MRNNKYQMVPSDYFTQHDFVLSENSKGKIPVANNKLLPSQSNQK